MNLSIIRSKMRKLGRALRKIKLMDDARHETIAAANTQKKFDDDHYKFAKDIFSDSAQPSSELTFDADVAEKHFRNAYSYPKRSNMYTPPSSAKTATKTFGCLPEVLDQFEQSQFEAFTQVQQLKPRPK